VPDKRTERLSEWLSTNRAHYKELKAKLEDPKRVLQLLRDIYGYMEPVLSINQESQPHEAMFAIGATKAGLESVFEEIAFFSDYEEKRGQMAQLKQELTNGGVTPGEEQPAHLDVIEQPAATQ
jgi:hypothetical protein